MARLWLVARHEYLKAVRRRAFLLSTLGIPLFLVLVMGVAIVVAIGGRPDVPVGFVDHSGVLAPGLRPPASDDGDDIEMRGFADEAAARAALEAGQIAAYYVVPADYQQARRVGLNYWDNPPGEQVQSAFDALMLANLAAGQPAEVQRRIVDGVDLTMRSADGRREVGDDDFLSFLLPFAAGMFFVFAVMMSAGYLLQVVTDEKENRTIEVMVTSLSPEQLIGGKALGLMGVALTQISVWVLAAVIGIVIGAQFMPALRGLRVPWDFIGVSVLYFLPAYALIAGMMTAVGGMVTESRQGQQIAGVLNMMFVAPYFFVVLMLTNPESPVVTVLTLFPTTAFITITLRWGLSLIPTWQLLVSWALLVSTALVSLWASARIFRAGMLHYGQQLSLRAAMQAVRRPGR